jgi:hypothetical protein
MKSCAGCKYFVSLGVTIPECRFNPPRTTQFVIGLDAQRRPQIHSSITFSLVQPDFWCGQWAPKLALN